VMELWQGILVILFAAALLYMDGLWKEWFK
jgi:hypothetical protein